MDEPRGGVLHRLAQVEKALERLDETVEEHGRMIALLIEQISGERGLNAAVRALADRFDTLTKAAWALAAILITALVGLAFNALLLLSQ